jgi:heavy metal translocating P-type ATPase
VRSLKTIIPLAAIALLVVAGILWWLRLEPAATVVPLAGLVLTALPLLKQTVGKALHGDFATDAIAALAIITAIALRQPIPGLVIVLMQSGGEWLELMAQRRASRALDELESSAPRIAHRAQDEHFVDVPVAQLAVDDVILVRAGDIIPVDGVVVDGRAHVDTSRITGEPLPVSATAGTQLYSGCVAIDSVLRMRVTRIAAESQYERIVQLVREALARKAPLQRVADRYAVWFTPLTVVLAAVAYAVSGDPTRVLAVLVVATPCPLIIATPVAIVAGINRAARLGFLFRSGAALEQLANVRAMIFDKTGTLTTGKARVVELVALDGQPRNDLLDSVAAVELGSSHQLGREIVRFAQTQGASPSLAPNIEELPGRGVRGNVRGRAIAVGSEDFIIDVTGMRAADVPHADAAALRSYIAVDGRLAGYITFADQIRADLPDMLVQLRGAGVQHASIVSGDDEATVRAVATQLQIEEAHGDMHPEDKVAHVARVKKQQGVTAMIGDGVNDAPALAAADVGIAVAARGGGIAAETADVVLLGQDLTAIAGGVRIARRTLRIARQSIGFGLGFSVVAMMAASAGYIPPLAGALYQELLDVAVILNALRAAAPAH